MTDRIPYTACPLCASPRFAKVREDVSEVGAVRMVWMGCNDCGHSFIEGPFTPEALARIFAETQECQRVGYQYEQQRLIAARMINWARPDSWGGTWLDVGCGNGALLLTAAEYGFDPVGLDLRESTVKDLQAVGIEAHCQDFLLWRRQADVISMCDVLEHMPDPKGALEQARRLIAVNGTLLLSMPNMDAPIFHLLEPVCSYWKEVEHYHNFGRRRLYALLDECGWLPYRYGVSERYRACMEVIARPG